MVDVGDKPPSQRRAVALGVITLSPEAYSLVKDSQQSKKGSVLGVAQIAGIMAAKQTAQLIPLCHSIPLNSIHLDFVLCDSQCCVEVRAEVGCVGRTGVEMEALCAVSVALLTVYDMTKAVSQEHVISDIRLLEKEGGRSGLFRRHPQ